MVSPRAIRMLAIAGAGALLVHQASACEPLTGRTFGATEIASAEVVAAGSFSLESRTPGAAALNATLAGLPAFCRVRAVGKPSADSAIGIEIWLPEQAWNGRLLAVGNGAWAGSISYSALADAVADGYAAASTDTGHVGNNVEFAIGHPEKLVDFAHRAVHEMAVAAKAVVEAKYSRTADRSYFAGCSTGGRQALAAAQRYPADFDGIVAGAPAYYPSHIQGMQVWTAAVTANQPGVPLGPNEFGLLNDGAVAACDALDGVTDGVIENPQVCTFDPHSLVCASGSTSICLSPAQADTAGLIYRGPVDDAGRSVFPGLARGSERGWRTLSDERPLGLAFDTYARLVFDDASWDFRTFDAARDIPLAVERIGPLMDSADPNLHAFVERGGKLLLYHGWSDPGIPAGGTIRYYDQVRSALGADAGESARLFMVPGMGHCRGGTGTDTFDAVAALDQWVRMGTAPERIEAARVESGVVVRTRPLCSYPTQAVYDGSGSTDDSANFVCMLAQPAAPPLRVLSSNGVRAVVETLVPDLEATIGRKLNIEFSTAASHKVRISNGEPFDVAILTPALIDALVAEQKIAAASRQNFARAGVGVGVRAGAAKPDVSTLDGFKRALLEANSVTFTADGQSRQAIDRAFDRLGIVADMRAKTLLKGPGEPPHVVAAGEAEIVLTLVSEILPVEGVQLVGPLPAEVQNYVAFTAGRSATASDTIGADALLRYLASPKASAELGAHGMEPYER